MSTAVSFAREGELLHLQGNVEESLRVLSAGVHRHPRDVTGRLVLARVCRENGRENEARDWLESVLRDDAACPAARLQLAEILGGLEGEYHFGQLRTQEPWDEGFREGAVVAPAPAPVFPEPGSVSVFDEDLVDEEDDIEATIDRDSLPHVATVTLAEIYLQQGLRDQAAQIYRQLLERQPGDASVRMRLEEIESV